jgi:hypothetical protein
MFNCWNLIDISFWLLKSLSFHHVLLSGSIQKNAVEFILTFEDISGTPFKSNLPVLIFLICFCLTLSPLCLDPSVKVYGGVIIISKVASISVGCLMYRGVVEQM